VLTFIGLPFVVRTVQPVLENLESEMEEVACSSVPVAGRTFTRCCCPNLAGAAHWLHSRICCAIGEYGSVLFIAGNMPMRTEIAPLLVMAKPRSVRLSGSGGDFSWHAHRVIRVAAAINACRALAEDTHDEWPNQRASGPGPNPEKTVSRRAVHPLRRTDIWCRPGCD